MNIPISFKCAAPGCDKSSVGNHIICNYHLFVEIAVTVAISITVLWGAIYAILVISGK